MGEAVLCRANNSLLILPGYLFPTNTVFRTARFRIMFTFIIAKFKYFMLPKSYKSITANNSTEQ